MTHHVCGLIARAEALAAFAAATGLHRPASLRQGFAFLPLEADDIDALGATLDRDDDAAGPVFKGLSAFRCLTDACLRVLLRHARLGAFAYVETDYFGGRGDQGAVAIAAGAVVFGPERGARGPVSGALRRIGATRGAYDDEFDALGLGARRRNADWIEAGAAQAGVD